MSLSIRPGSYEIVASSDSGGRGESLLADDTKLRREVALKVLAEVFSKNPDRMARFERKAELLASLNHPNIAAIFGLEDGAIVMALVDGPTLGDRITCGPLSLDEAYVRRTMAKAA